MLASLTRTYCLSYRIDFVRDLQVRQLFLDLLRQFIRSEAHGVDVVSAHGQRLSWGFHDLERSPQTVVNVHHRKPRVWLQVALKLAGLDSIMEYLHSII